ncbi:MAG: hypothetical protein A2252_07375 [Elusimicrobia bacterium RIFOXYA2_FULL_39_19]|nr:MAG: hypothetical protein A2252_07375 [Elusimicrobia bacterium RIFOXYA2_FULL_39_19]
MTRILKYIQKYGLLFLIVFTPFAYGSVEVWSFSILCFVSLIIFCVWVYSKISSKENIIDSFKKPYFLPIIFFLTVLAFQVIPIPKEILKTIAPSTNDIYLKYLSGISEWKYGCISIYSYASIVEIIKMLAYIMVFIVIIDNIKTKKQMDVFITAILITGFLIAIFGIIQKYSWNGKIFWFRELMRGGTPFGPFVNRNHAAGYLDMIMPISLGLLLTERDQSKKVLFGFISTVIGGAIIVSLSRGGIFSFLWSVVFISVLLVIFTNKSKGLLVIFSLTVFLVIFVNWLGKDEVIKRIATVANVEGENSVSLRAEIWKDTLKIVKDFPVIGTGIGTFSNIFPKYKTIKERLIFTHTENDYIQLLAETGFIGFIIFVCLMFMFFLSVLFKMFKRKDRNVQELTICFLGSCIGMCIFSFLDFNLHIPSNALLFTIIIGLTINIVNVPRLNEYKPDLEIKDEKQAVNKGQTLKNNIVLVTISIFAIIYTFMIARIFISDIYFKNKDYAKASYINASNAEYQYLLGKNNSDFKFVYEKYKKAIQLNPTNGRYMLSLGGLYVQMKDIKKAEDTFNKALALVNYQDPYYYFYAGYYYKKIGENKLASNYFAKTLKIDPSYDKKIKELVNK